MRQTQSVLFTIRLWREAVGDDAWEWRGMVKHVTSGEERYFREWSGLPETIQGMLPELEEQQEILFVK